MVHSTDLVADLARLMKVLPSSAAKVVVRSNSEAEKLVSRHSGEFPTLYCPPLRHLGRAVQFYLQGKQVQALALATAAIDLTVFHYEGVEVETLLDKSIDPQSWRKLAVRCLLGAVSLPTTGTVYEWQALAGQLMTDQLVACPFPSGLFVNMVKLVPQKRKGSGALVSNFLRPVRGDSPAHVQTIHGVKGETHDLTVIVLSKPTSTRPCPSETWWTQNNLEERRVAYVAMTRTRGDLVILAHQVVFENLKSKRSSFFTEFETVALEELQEHYSNRDIRV